MTSPPRAIVDISSPINFNGDRWYAIDPKLFAQTLVTRLGALEGQKLGLVMEALEATAVLAGSTDLVDEEEVTGQEGTTTNLVDHLSVLEKGIAEYDLRIGALLRAIEGIDLL